MIEYRCRLSLPQKCLLKIKNTSFQYVLRVFRSIGARCAVGSVQLIAVKNIYK